jgi:hypothetical protein
MSLAKEIPVVRWMRMFQSCITGTRAGLGVSVVI